MIGHCVSFRTTDGLKFVKSNFLGANFHENVRNDFIHMNFLTFSLKTCQNIKFNEYENHSSQKQKTLKILFIIDRYTS